MIIGGLDLLIARLREPRAKRLASNALEAARRGEQLVRQLLAFSRGQSIEIGAVDLRDVLANSRPLLRRTLGSQVRLSARVDDRARWVTSNADQLELAILNLAINSQDAMPEGGEFRFEARPDNEDGSRVRIEIRDTGLGMSPEVAERALEPFFTTKPHGKGTGLGLAQVYGIVRQSGGEMSITSQPGGGTTIALVLPAAETGAGARRPKDRPRSRPVSKEGVRILVADDDEGVRGVMAEALRKAGYDVIEAKDGPAALEACGEAPPDLLLADYSMPGMNGVELAQQTRAIKDDLPVIIVSGYSDTEAVKGALPGVPLLRKPFSAGKLIEAVNTALAPPDHRPPS